LSKVPVAHDVTWPDPDVRPVPGDVRRAKGRTRQGTFGSRAVLGYRGARVDGSPVSLEVLPPHSPAEGRERPFERRCAETVPESGWTLDVPVIDAELAGLTAASGFQRAGPGPNAGSKPGSMPKPIGVGRARTGFAVRRGRRELPMRSR
jgi:hypothetical protein